MPDGCSFSLLPEQTGTRHVRALGSPQPTHHSVRNAVTSSGEVGPDPGSGGGLRCGGTQQLVITSI